MCIDFLDISAYILWSGLNSYTIVLYARWKLLNQNLIIMKYYFVK